VKSLACKLRRLAPDRHKLLHNRRAPASVNQAARRRLSTSDSCDLGPPVGSRVRRISGQGRICSRPGVRRAKAPSTYRPRRRRSRPSGRACGAVMPMVWDSARRQGTGMIPPGAKRIVPGGNSSNPQTGHRRAEFGRGDSGGLRSAFIFYVYTSFVDTWTSSNEGCV